MASRLSSADIDRVYCRAFKNDMTDLRIGCDRSVNQVLDIAGVGEIETGVNPKRQNTGIGHPGVAFYFAKSRRTGN
jgi:hypothetical protein